MVDLAAREVNLALEYTAFCHQLLQDGQRLAQGAIHRALDPGLLKQRASDRRIAFDLSPAARFFVELGVDR